MTNSSKQNQESGSNSTNLQGQSVVVNQGISYSDAKEIAIDVFKSNFLELSQQAAQTAVERAEELVDDFIGKLEERAPESIDNVETPGLQHALFNAQKEYARTGDKDLSDVLVDILVDRAKEKERNLKQIVLDESINVVPKLTTEQLDSLSLIFLLKYSQNFSVVDDNSLYYYLTTYIKPFLSGLSKELSLYQHLEFSGCGSVSLGERKLQEIFKITYKGLFLKGFNKEDFENTFENHSDYEKLLIPCINDNEKFQINARNDEHLEQNFEALNITEQEVQNKLKDLFGRNQMNDNEILDKLSALDNNMTAFVDIWNESSMKNMTLTSVGIAVAHANIRRRTNITMDLGIWIK